MTIAEFDSNQFSYSIEEIAQEVTILPQDDEATIFRKRAVHFVVEGNPEDVASQVRRLTDQVGIEAARQVFTSPNNFSQIALSSA